MINNDNLELAKAIVKIKDILPKEIGLKREGRNSYRADSCPLCGIGYHFTIYEVEGVSKFKAFNCTNDITEGSVVDFIMILDNITLKEAIDKTIRLSNLENINEEDKLIMVNEIREKREKAEKEFTNPVDKTKYLDRIEGECLEYLKSRGLSEKIIESFNIKQHTNKGFTNIVFPYHETDYDNAEDVQILSGKVRVPKNIGKNEGLKYWTLKIEGFENEGNYTDYGLIFNEPNIQALLDKEGLKELIVTEGEIDCMTIAECGYQNVVSIPNGVASVEKVVEKRKDFFDRFQKIIVISDNDDAGKTMDEAFKKIIGSKVVIIDKKLIGFKTKDINGEYLANGKNKIQLIIDSANLKIQGLIDVSKYVRDNKISKRKQVSNKKYISTGFYTLDRKLNYFQTGYVTVLGGHTSQGKSTIIEQVQNVAINEGHGVLRIDCEHILDDMIDATYKKIVGDDSSKYDIIVDGYEEEKVVKPEIEDLLEAWHRNKWFIHQPSIEEKNDNNKLFDKIKAILDSEKISLVIIDNLMKVVKPLNENAKYAMQANFIDICNDLAKTHNVHIIVVAHNNKASKGNIVDENSISGSANIGDMADIVIQVERNNEATALQINGKTYYKNGFMTLCKNRQNKGKLAIKISEEQDERIILEYSSATGSLNEIVPNKGKNVNVLDYERFKYDGKAETNELIAYKNNLNNYQRRLFDNTVEIVTEVDGDVEDLPY